MLHSSSCGPANPYIVVVLIFIIYSVKYTDAHYYHSPHIKKPKKTPKSTEQMGKGPQNTSTKLIQHIGDGLSCAHSLPLCASFFSSAPLPYAIWTFRVWLHCTSCPTCPIHRQNSLAQRDQVVINGTYNTIIHFDSDTRSKTNIQFIVSPSMSIVHKVVFLHYLHMAHFSLIAKP